MREKLDLEGKKFEHLVYIRDAMSRISGGQKRRFALFCCDCGNEKEICVDSVMRGESKSCGCFQRKVAAQNKKTHGLRKHPLYIVWRSMKARCFNLKEKSYKNYGGRGIIMCAEWYDFKCFYDWAISNNWQKGLQIDRRNNNGNYEPSNCRFVTRIINNRNRRDNRIITYNGISICLSEWAEKLGISGIVISRYIDKYGWGIERILRKHQIA